MAAYELTNLGFKTGVRVLKGGFNEWRKSGRCGCDLRHLHATHGSCHPCQAVCQRMYTSSAGACVAVLQESGDARRGRRE